MQALSVIHDDTGYIFLMQRGRPSKRPRPPFGERLAAAREQMGLSQIQLADKLGVSQKVITYWEHNHVGLRAEQLISLASALNISVEELVGQPKPRSRGGPVGKARRVFEEVSSLPRHQQQRIIGVVEDLLAVQRGNSHKKAA
jgi:transcriptional regulator with XRE-family HTH domain